MQGLFSSKFICVLNLMLVSAALVLCVPSFAADHTGNHESAKVGLGIVDTLAVKHEGEIGGDTAKRNSGAATVLNSPEVPEENRAVWENLAPGLELAVLDFQSEDKIVVTVLRIDPDLYEFSLYSSLWDEVPPRPLLDWADAYDLLAAINACMFLPDGSSTAYMRRGAQQNRSTVADKYGGFFVFGTAEPGLPKAAILDKTSDDWQSLLPKYDVAIQNMRLIGNDGEQLWPEDGPLHAVAAIGQDVVGNILFMHCRSAINVHRLVSALLASPSLNLSRAIYVEGGSQAALTLRLPGQVSTWTGRRPADLFFRGSGAKYSLPNIVGIRPRQAAFETIN